MKLTVSQLFIYPVKSFSGISVESHSIDDRGFSLDRRWMLIDTNNNFVSQRTLPQMALVTTELTGNSILLKHKIDESFLLELEIGKHTGILTEAILFDKKTEGYLLSEYINRYLSNFFGINLRMIYMAEDIKRYANKKYAHSNEIVSYADGFPFLIIGEESLNELNRRMTAPVDITRFRPNIVFNGGTPFIEDDWKEIKIGNVKFRVVKPCSRCVIVTVDPETAKKNNETLTVLSKFRREGHKIYFGQNLLHSSVGNIQVGNEIEVLT